MSHRAAFSAVFQLLQLPAGRRALALREVGLAATAVGDAALAEQASAFAELELRQLDLEHTWRQQRAGLIGGADPELSALDRQIDALLTDLHTLLEVHARGRVPARSAPARLLLTDAFEAAVVDHTHLPWSMQAPRTLLLLQKLAEPDKAEAVQKLDLKPLVDELGVLNAAFTDRLAERSSQRVAWEQVEAGNADGTLRYLRVVAAIFAAYGAPEQEATFSRLIAPIMRQEAQLRAWRKSRRSPPPDVDPATGADVEPLPTGAPEIPAEG